MGCCCSSQSERERENQRKKHNEENQPKELASSTHNFAKEGTLHKGVDDGTDAKSVRGKKRAISTDADRQLYIERAKKATKPLAEFSLNLFKRIVAENSSANIIFSPVSIALALALIEGGTNGSTQTALRNALGGNDNDFDTSVVYQSIQRLLRFQEGETSLTIANGLFHDLKFKMKSAYLSNVKDGFDSEIDGVDFAKHKDAAISRINSWVSERTDGRIKDLLEAEKVSNDTVLVLVNAIYSKAKWRVAFRKEAIETMPFYRQGQDANPQKVQFLCALDDYVYVDDIDFQTVGIPYSSVDQPLDFYVILPKERNGIGKVEGQLTEAKLRSIFQSRKREKVDLKFPEFAVRAPVGLKPILKDLGLGAIFDVHADFTRMNSDYDFLYVSDAVHEAYIKVDEIGTEAAAATAVIMVAYRSLLPLDEPIRFLADHPFIFAIVHQKTQTVVFLGKVNSVEEDMS